MRRRFRRRVAKGDERGRLDDRPVPGRDQPSVGIHGLGAPELASGLDELAADDDPDPLEPGAIRWLPWNPQDELAGIATVRGRTGDDPDEEDAIQTGHSRGHALSKSANDSSAMGFVQGPRPAMMRDPARRGAVDLVATPCLKRVATLHTDAFVGTWREK